MKYFAIITLALFIFSCENEGKKKEVSEQVGQTSESEDPDIKNVEFNGKVLNAKDCTAISMAFIVVPGTNIGTMTDANGEFLINAPDGTKKLLFIMDGYEKSTVEVEKDKKCIVMLKAKIN